MNVNWRGIGTQQSSPRCSNVPVIESELRETWISYSPSTGGYYKSDTPEYNLTALPLSQPIQYKCKHIYMYTHIEQSV
jgi:hypothetical protein